LATLFGVLANWHFQELIKNLNRSSSELTKLTAPPFEKIKEELERISPFPAKDSSENDYQEFVSPDKKIKIKYPAGWIVVEREPQGLIPKDWQETHNLKIIFLAQQLGASGVAQLIVYQGNFTFSVEEIIEKMHEANRQQGQEIEIIDSKIGEKEGTLEVIYKMPENYDLHSKEKILKEGEDAYLIAFTTLDENWNNFAEQADFVINSAQIFSETLTEP